MSEQVAIRRLAQAVEILARRTTREIGTIDAQTVMELCQEARDAVEGA